MSSIDLSKHPDIEGYNNIGSLLRRAREDMRLTPEQTSRLLHIRVRYLTALEEGHLHALPGVTYTRGYLQAYASFLGLDKDEILRRFEAIEQLLTQKHIYFPTTFSKEKTPHYSLIWGGVIVGLLVYGIWLMVFEPSKFPISIVEKMEKIASTTIYSGNVACVRGTGVYYPPCTMPYEVDTNLLPLHSMNSIMELTITGSDIEGVKQQ